MSRIRMTMRSCLSNPRIRGVAIATPAATHGELVRRCLHAGKDVFVEKPLCMSTAEGAAGRVGARERAHPHGGTLAVVSPHRAGAQASSWIAGELGRIQYIYSNRLNMGKLRQEENVLWSFAPHDASVILGLVGDMPESVQAQGGSFLHHKISDTTVSMLTFASGLRAHIFVSWLHPFKEQKLVVVGDRKMAVFNDTVAWSDKLHLYPHSVAWRDNQPVAQKGEPERMHVAEEEPLRAECSHFLECMETRSSPRTDGEEGLRVLRRAKRLSARLEENSPVALAEPVTDFFVARYGSGRPGCGDRRGDKDMAFQPHPRDYAHRRRLCGWSKRGRRTGGRHRQRLQGAKQRLRLQGRLPWRTMYFAGRAWCLPTS